MACRQPFPGDPGKGAAGPPFVVGPARDNEAGFRGAAAVKGDFLDAAAGADIEVPGVARRRAALGWIFHHDFLGGTLSQRQFLHASVFHRRSGIPRNMKCQEQPVLIVYKTRLDLPRLGVKLRAQIRELYRLARFILSVIGDLVGLRFPNQDRETSMPGSCALKV